MSQEDPDIVEFVIHENTKIGRCRCGEHHWHLIKIGSAIYLQCGRCGRLINIIMEFEAKKKAGI